MNSIEAEADVLQALNAAKDTARSFVLANILKMIGNQIIELDQERTERIKRRKLLYIVRRHHIFLKKQKAFERLKSKEQIQADLTKTDEEHKKQTAEGELSKANRVEISSGRGGECTLNISYCCCGKPMDIPCGTPHCMIPQNYFTNISYDAATWAIDVYKCMISRLQQALNAGLRVTVEDKNCYILITFTHHILFDPIEFEINLSNRFEKCLDHKSTITFIRNQLEVFSTELNVTLPSKLTDEQIALAESRNMQGFVQTFNKLEFSLNLCVHNEIYYINSHQTGSIKECPKEYETIAQIYCDLWTKPAEPDIRIWTKEGDFEFFTENGVMKRTATAPTSYNARKKFTNQTVVSMDTPLGRLNLKRTNKDGDEDGEQALVESSRTKYGWTHVPNKLIPQPPPKDD